MLLVICSFEKYNFMTVRNKLTINELPGILDLNLLVFLKFTIVFPIVNKRTKNHRI